MKKKKSLLKFILCILLVFNMIYVSAHKKKIAIITYADTSIVHQHLGMTAFSNFTVPLDLDIAVTQHLKQKFQIYLSPKYDVNIIEEIPDSIFYTPINMAGKLSGTRKDIKNWLINTKSKYDYIIFITSRNIAPYELQGFSPITGSGLFSKSNYSGIYSNITFVAYRMPQVEGVSYPGLYGKNLIKPLKKFKLPKDKKRLTPEMLITIENEFIKHLDNCVEHFLINSYMVPKNEIEKIKVKND